MAAPSTRNIIPLLPTEAAAAAASAVVPYRMLMGIGLAFPLLVPLLVLFSV